MGGIFLSFKFESGVPERLGKWSAVYQRYAYWCGKGHFEHLFRGMQQPDLEEVTVDSTCCRAHQASAGARKTNGAQAIGLTHGGLNTKIHIAGIMKWLH